jgi:hypothetical protein
MNFNVMIGNPPYQNTVNSQGFAVALYNYFITLGNRIARFNCLIV